ncbi:unnamed protein product [Dicrocoelium dendriticum]|nr:unnamed protein product [Dicrocoelium dendriticum]
MSRHWLRCAILDHIRTTSSWLVRGLVYLCRFSCVRFSIHDYFLILFTECSVQRAAKAIYKQVIHDYGDTLRVLVPSVLYTIQNTLLYVAISNLNAVTYQILYQFKIFTTAIFMVILLGRKLSAAKWIALVMLCLGIVLSQLNPETVSSSPPSNRTASSPFAGLCAIVFATVSSGFAGVYFEKILKGTAPSIWMRNIQLAAFGIVVGLIGVYASDREAVLNNGFFQGYTPLVWLIIVLQTCSGLCVAFVMKYADNILKGFATGLSMLLSSAISYFVLGDFQPTVCTFVGATLVIAATMLYGREPKQKPQSVNAI